MCVCAVLMVLPYSLGDYSFLVEMTHITCAFSVELWLSTDSDPMSSRKIIATHMPPVVSIFTSLGVDVIGTIYEIGTN